MNILTAPENEVTAFFKKRGTRYPLEVLTVKLLRVMHNSPCGMELTAMLLKEDAELSEFLSKMNRRFSVIIERERALAKLTDYEKDLLFNHNMDFDE